MTNETTTTTKKSGYMNIPVKTEEYARLLELKFLYRCKSWTELMIKLRERSKKYGPKETIEGQETSNDSD